MTGRGAGRCHARNPTAPVAAPAGKADRVLTSLWLLGWRVTLIHAQRHAIEDATTMDRLKHDTP